MRAMAGENIPDRVISDPAGPMKGDEPQARHHCERPTSTAHATYIRPPIWRLVSSWATSCVLMTLRSA